MMEKKGKLRRRFIEGHAVEDNVKELISRAASIKVAVAYWGSGSFEHFHASLASKDVIIVCDLMSGACNPDEIKKFRDTFGKSRVLTRDHLHAKAWLTDRGAIVGSSNVSANGLGFEGDEINGSVEANVFVDDAQTLNSIGGWFEKDVIKHARVITESAFKEARRRWKRRRNARTLGSTKGSLIDALITSPSSFEDRDFIVWVEALENLDKWAKKALASEQEIRNNSNISCFQNVDFKPLTKPGSYVLWFDLNQNGTVRFDGFYQILTDAPLIKTNDGNILLLKNINQFEGLPLGDKRIWKRAATRAVSAKEDCTTWKIGDFAVKFLRETD